MVAKEKGGREAVEAEVERLENEMGELEEKLEDAEDSWEQYEGCYRHWEKVARDRAMLIEELWEQLPCRGVGNRPPAGEVQSEFYGTGAPWEYYWIDDQGRCSWEFPGHGDEPAEEVVYARSGLL